MSLPLGRKNVAVFDERRNSSRVWPVTQEDVELAETALFYFRKNGGALYEWIAEGAPRLTAAEHLRRFGEPYKAARSRKATPQEALA